MPPIAEGLDVHRFPVAIGVTGEVEVSLEYPAGVWVTHEELEEAMAGIDLSGYVKSSEKGAPNGVATLGPDGKVPGEQLPDIGGVYEVEEAVPPASRKANTLYGLILADYTGTGGEG
ncbi:hypothetical protein LIP85_17955 [Flavonifractor plautii]|nr:hypothetical protein [Flavonifractor plautii]MCB5377636.1 hypothetical protein [Flavonifractor plautii]